MAEQRYNYSMKTKRYYELLDVRDTLIHRINKYSSGKIVDLELYKVHRHLRQKLYLCEALLRRISKKAS